MKCSCYSGVPEHHNQLPLCKERNCASLQRVSVPIISSMGQLTGVTYCMLRSNTWATVEVSNPDIVTLHWIVQFPRWTYEPRTHHPLLWGPTFSTAYFTEAFPAYVGGVAHTQKVETTSEASTKRSIDLVYEPFLLHRRIGREITLCYPKRKKL